MTWTHIATTSAASSVVMLKAGVCRTTARHSSAARSRMLSEQGLVRAASLEFTSTHGLDDSCSTRTVNHSVGDLSVMSSAAAAAVERN